jgi:hypothetical protein
MSQKGGLLLPFKDEKNNKETFISYLEHSDINKLSRGAYGLTFLTQLILKPSEHSDWIIGKSKRTNMRFYFHKNLKLTTYDIPDDISNDPSTMPMEYYYKKVTPNIMYGKPIQNLVLKLCIINDSTIYAEHIFGGHLHSVKESDFQNEINIQTEIFFKTLQYLQPICPAIVYSEILSVPEQIEELLLLFMQNGETEIASSIQNLIYFFHNNPSVKLGLIAMELADDGDTLNNVQQYYIKKKDRRKIVMFNNIGRYALLRLAVETGYTHNDFHKHNIMVTQTGDYFDDPKYGLRPIIIDFGRAVKIPQEYLNKLKMLVKEQNYIDALKILCNKDFAYPMISDIRYAATHYGWICGDYDMTENDYDNYVVKLQVQVNDEIDRYNDNPSNVKKKDPVFENDIRLKIPKPTDLTEEDNRYIDKFFILREKGIERNIETMKKLHDLAPDTYPLLPISDQIKGSLYKGLFGGKKRRQNRKKSYKRRTNRNKRTRKQNNKVKK